MIVMSMWIILIWLMNSKKNNVRPQHSPLKIYCMSFEIYWYLSYITCIYIFFQLVLERALFTYAKLLRVEAFYVHFHQFPESLPLSWCARSVRKNLVAWVNVYLVLFEWLIRNYVTKSIVVQWGQMMYILTIPVSWCS